MRKYLPTLSELIDRLSIVQLKEVFITDHKKEYAKEIEEITHDIGEILNDGNIRLTGLTHGLNGIRNTAKNMIQKDSEGRKDYKIDCIAAEFKDWEISW